MEVADESGTRRGTYKVTPGVGAPTQSEPGEVPTMVASELVGPEDELPPYLPRRRRQEVHPDVCTSGGTSKCGSTTSRSGYTAADSRVEANRQVREEAGDARQLEKLRIVRGVVPDTRPCVEERTCSEGIGQSSVARHVDAGKPVKRR